MADNDLEIEEGGKSKMMMIIIIAAVVIIGGGITFYLTMGGDEAPVETVAEETVDAGDDAPEDSMEDSAASVGDKRYVPLPRPFVFTVPGETRDRLVEIKVQIMVAGPENEETVKKHIPLIEGALLGTFSEARAEDLMTEAGKKKIRADAKGQVQTAVKEIVGKSVIHDVLFTGFVMQ